MNKDEIFYQDIGCKYSFCFPCILRWFISSLSVSLQLCMFHYFWPKKFWLFAKLSLLACLFAELSMYAFLRGCGPWFQFFTELVCINLWINKTKGFTKLACEWKERKRKWSLTIVPETVLVGCILYLINKEDLCNNSIFPHKFGRYVKGTYCKYMRLVVLFSNWKVTFSWVGQG